ncbi:hypothetical protein AB1K62_03720 [Parasphingorhabdus sp. JC815]|uniref:hypothetical protein n=1 Tax=Parasphingorhabdus sp. JC815 TaxID=3232140 RepID=UPI00345AB785
MHKYINWRNFWIFWLGGLAVFIFMVFTSGSLATDIAPGGIVDHQRAGSAERINAIQQSWAAAGQMSQARWSMITDLVFIGLYSIGGIIGGRLLWQDAHSPSLKKLGLLLVLIYFLFGLLDYIETICQITQLLQEQGDDRLASIAAFVMPPKSLALIVGTLGMIAALIWRSRERRA